VSYLNSNENETEDTGNDDDGNKDTEVIALCVIPEESRETEGEFNSPGLSSATKQSTLATPETASPDYPWRSPESEGSEIPSIQSETWIDREQHK
jgi:hypothetical protein